MEYILARINFNKNFNKIQNQLIINKETERLLEGGISTGFFNPDTSQIVEFGDLYVPIYGILKGKVNFNQKHEENDIRNYSLIVFADFIQQEFTVYNESYFSFPFSLEGKEGIVIDFELEINVPDVHEFSYIILFEPELKDVNVSNERLIKNLFYTIGIASWRLLLNEEEWSMQEILKSYYEQACVEKLFRDTKNKEHFSICLIYHWTDQKIKVHIFYSKRSQIYIWHQ